MLGAAAPDRAGRPALRGDLRPGAGRRRRTRGNTDRGHAARPHRGRAGGSPAAPRRPLQPANHRRAVRQRHDRRVHLGHIFDKLGIRSRKDLIDRIGAPPSRLTETSGQAMASRSGTGPAAPGDDGGETPGIVEGRPAGVGHDGGVASHGEDARDALVRQWQAIAAAVVTLDLETPSRVAGWRNREVVAHLCLQPALLRRFIASASTRHAVVNVAASLAGTHSLAGLVDASAREAAEAGRVDFAKAVRDAVPTLRAADLSATVVTLQGPIRLAD